MAQENVRVVEAAYMQERLDLFDEFHTEVVELIDAGNDQVVTYLRYSGRLKASGMDVPPEALEAVGMRE